MAKISAVCLSEAKGMRKRDVGAGRLIANFGLEGDAHASAHWHRQVSLLALESIEKMRAQGLKVGPGDFAENITTEGLELHTLPIGTRLRLGAEAVGEISQIGKECHNRCAIYEQAGDCVMPREGIFLKVLRGGEIKNGDAITVDNSIITVGVIVASDACARGQREDRSGPTAAQTVAKIGALTLETVIVPDELEALTQAMRRMADECGYDLILTSGGTGFSPRDVTPEATLAVIERAAPGLAEAMRAASLAVSPHAMLSRAMAGIRGHSLIINLPGSPRAVRECLEVILPALPHGVEVLRGLASNCAKS
jgi:molybdenum cofactor synthesis domain-containing protein